MRPSQSMSLAVADELLLYLTGWTRIQVGPSYFLTIPPAVYLARVCVAVPDQCRTRKVEGRDGKARTSLGGSGVRFRCQRLQWRVLASFGGGQPATMLQVKAISQVPTDFQPWWCHSKHSCSGRHHWWCLSPFFHELSNSLVRKAFKVLECSVKKKSWEHAQDIMD